MSCVIENEDLAFGESESGNVYLFLKKSNKYIPMKDIDKCIWGDNNKFVFYIAEEEIKKKQSVFKKPVISNKPFNNFVQYPKYELKLEDMKPLVLQQEKTIENQIPQNDVFPIDTLFIGGAATIAMLMSVFQQAKQKKQQIESNKCCADSKIEIQKVNYKLQEFEQKVNAKNEKENKALYAEMYEHYKELKEVKEEVDDTKQVLSKAINHIQEISNVKKRTED